MKIRPLTLILIPVVCICPSAFSQKCKGKIPDIGEYTNQGGPKIKRKPQAEYTEEARRHETSGTVVVRALFHSSGKVQNVCWVSSLPYGLTEKAIKAAYQIVFEPVIKDGKPASVTAFIQYNFILY
jgi:TonB family protein